MSTSFEPRSCSREGLVIVRPCPFDKAISFGQIQLDVLTSELKAANIEKRLEKEPVRMYMILISIMSKEVL